MSDMRHALEFRNFFAVSPGDSKLKSTSIAVLGLKTPALLYCTFMLRKYTHHPLLASAPGVSSASPLSCHRRQWGLSLLTGLSGDEASYSSARQTQGSENPSPWMPARVICAGQWSGYLWHCCPSVHPPKPQNGVPLGQCKPSPQKKPRSS